MNSSFLRYMQIQLVDANDCSFQLAFLLKYRKPFHATRWVMLYMKDKVDFFSPTHLQALDVVLLKLSNLHNGLY